MLINIRNEEDLMRFQKVIKNLEETFYAVDIMSNCFIAEGDEMPFDDALKEAGSVLEKDKKRLETIKKIGTYPCVISLNMFD